MNVVKFGEDLSRKAQLVASLAAHDFDWPDLAGQSFVFAGMGSSTYAAGAIANLLNAHGVPSLLTLASNPLPPKANHQSTYIGISASGKSIETLAAFENATGYNQKLMLTNAPSLDGAKVIGMSAGEERGGVGSLTYVATLIALLKLAEDLQVISGLEESILKASTAIADIYDRREEWLPLLEQDALVKDGTYFIAPQNRIASAEQSALMLRECPRLPAVACETGDWSHVDVYLTKTQEYRGILFPGSAWHDQLFEWTAMRKSIVIGIGFEDARLHRSIRYKHDDDEIVRLLSEVTFAELLAHSAWSKS